MPTFITKRVPWQQVFNNLISNAIKHKNCDREKTAISATYHKDYYEFVVTDSGK